MWRISPNPYTFHALGTSYIFVQAEDMFFDSDDMEKFADEGTMEDDLDGEF